MPITQEQSEIGNCDPIIIYGYKCKHNVKSAKHFEPIQVRDLELRQKYKILWLHTFERTRMHAGKIGISIQLDGGFQLVLPHRFKTMAEHIKMKKPENVFMSYVGRGKRNAYIIRFYDEDKLIEPDFI